MNLQLSTHNANSLQIPELPNGIKVRCQSGFGGGGWRSPLTNKIANNSRIIKNQQSLKAERLNCVKKHDALQASIRKCLLFSRRSVPEDLIWGKEVIS